MTEPLTPPECDLRGLEYMPLLGQRLFGSDFDAKATDSEWRAGITLWWAAWTQCPAASLPDDDGALCRLADLGRDMKAWRKVKAIALHGFIKCSDGRLYHPMLAQQALLAWDKRVKDRERKAQWRAKKHGQDADVPRDKTETEHGQDADVPADETRRDETVITLANANGADAEKLFWDSAKKYLSPYVKNPGAYLGGLHKSHARDAIMAAINDAQANSAVDPPSYIGKILGKATRGAAAAQAQQEYLGV